MRQAKYIYHLVDPSSGLIIYVGQSRNPYKRAETHRRKGLVGEVRVVAICGRSPHRDEMREIKRCAKVGHPLLNDYGVRENLRPNVYARLTRNLDAAVETHRKNLETSSGKRVRYSKAVRSLVTAGAESCGLL